MDILSIPYADVGELIVSIVSAAVAIVATVIAIHQSRRANHLATEANELAHQANELAQENYVGEGPNASIALRFDAVEGLLALVSSTGRLDVNVEDVVLRLDGTDVLISAKEEFVKRGDYPLKLVPSDSYQQEFSPYLLAAATQRYGGSHLWRAAPVIAGDIRAWSDPCHVPHPDEPSLEEQLGEFHQSFMDPFQRRLRAGSSSADEQAALAEEYAQLGVRLGRLRSRYDESDQFVRQMCATQLVNAERRFDEAKGLLPER